MKERIFGTHDTDLEWKTEVGIDEVLCVCGEPGGEWTQWGWRNEEESWFHRWGDACVWRSPVTSHLGDSQVSDNQLGDTSRSTRRQFMSFECLFRIDRTNKLIKKAVLSQGNHAMLLLISNMGISKNQTRRTFQHLLLLLLLQGWRPTTLILFNFYLILTTSAGANSRRFLVLNSPGGMQRR